MPAHPAPTRWELCARCRHITEPEKLRPLSSLFPERKRGWVCEDCYNRFTELIWQVHTVSWTHYHFRRARRHDERP
jgi:hypothetical protein